jgi:tRNA A-37 threonylcarbamoyl transferase component Bud32
MTSVSGHGRVKKVIGRLLDKYEILEEVGQGGMSVVYKGRDTSLKRDVAIKVLHPHLASHEEARRRFEREAQAVAKLRHDNILEIFDYSGKGSSDSYIVTEFIRGRTLKEFVSAHRIAYPEIAAMIVTEVCRALGHAHGLGVLHRDIKPENIMVRDDGRLKLMDFGIAQVIDTQRMTVTGQLLGSPAYMSPEHVEGKPLDFRTDLFSVGILLYQLATGELPFKGRNPHEILKKIAECKFLDARVVNPLVGERLGKILVRTLQRLPDDRYPDVGLLCDDLNRYLAEAELGEPRDELIRFFASPVSYEQALRQRLLSTLARRGKAELANRHVGAALELFNRVLTIDPGNEAVLAEIDKLSRKKRAVRGALLALGVLAVGGGALAVKTYWPPAHGASSATDGNGVRLDASAAHPSALAADAGLPSPAAADAAATQAVASLPDAAPRANATRADAGPRVAVATPAHAADAGPALPGRRITLTTNVKGFAEYSLDGGAFARLTFGRAEVDLPSGAHVLTIRCPICNAEEVRVAADDVRESIPVSLRYLPRTVRFRCDAAESTIVDGSRIVPASHEVPIDFGNADDRKIVVTFRIPGQAVQEKNVLVKPGDQPLEVTCDAP